MTRDDILQTLRLFNEKAEEVAWSSFGQTVLFQDTGFTMSGELGGPVTMERRGPDRTAIKEFVLTFRLFLNKRDLCSLHKLTKAYDHALIREEIRDEFLLMKTQLSQYLASPSPFRTESGCLSREQIMETFLWGDLAHVDMEFREQYVRWMSGGLSEFHWNQLVIVLGNYLKFIIGFHDLNAKVIIALGETL